MVFELILVLLGLIWFSHYQKLLKLPPGPFSLPLIGTIQVLQNGVGAGAALSPKYHKYGDFYTICLGPMTLVIINDFQLGKELFAKDEFSGNFQKQFFFVNTHSLNPSNLSKVSNLSKTSNLSKRSKLSNFIQIP